MRAAHSEEGVNLDLVRAFFLIVEHGSLNRAAERLRVSQSTLTRQIPALEQDIGGKLLERTSTGVAPTATGHALLDGMRPLLPRFDAVLQETRRLARGQSATLRIGYLPSAAGEFINPALAELRRAHPTVKVKLLDLSPGEQIAALRKGEIDLGLVGQAGAFLSREFYTRRLAALAVVVALPESNPLAAKETLRLAELRGELFIGALEADMPGHNRWIAQLCRRAKFRPRFIEDAESLSHSFSVMVTEGAVSLQPEYVKAAHVPGIVFRPLRDATARWEMFVAWQRGRTAEPVRALLAALPVQAAKE